MDNYIPKPLLIDGRVMRRLEKIQQLRQENSFNFARSIKWILNTIIENFLFIVFLLGIVIFLYFRYQWKQEENQMSSIRNAREEIIMEKEKLKRYIIKQNAQIKELQRLNHLSLKQKQQQFQDAYVDSMLPPRHIGINTSMTHNTGGYRGVNDIPQESYYDNMSTNIDASFGQPSGYAFI